MLITPENLKTLDYAYQGRPFVSLGVDGNLNLGGLEYFFQFEVFVSNYGVIFEDALSETSVTTDVTAAVKDREIVSIAETSVTSDTIHAGIPQKDKSIAETSATTDAISANVGADVSISEEAFVDDTTHGTLIFYESIAETAVTTALTGLVFGETVADIANTFPALEVVARTGAFLDCDFGAFTSTISATVGYVGRIAVDFPEFTTGMVTGARIDSNELASLQSAMAATALQIETIDVTLPAFTSSATLLNGTIATSAVTLPSFTGTGTASIPITAQIASTLPTFLTNAEAHSNIICALAETLSSLEVTATAKVGVIATSASTFPSFSTNMQLAVAVQTYCMNLVKRELISKFTNFNFNSYAVINGSDVAGSSSGLYSLGGETDAGSIIQSYIATPALMFETYLPKKVRGFRLGGRLNGNVTLSVTDGVTTWSDTVDFEDSLLMQIRKGYFQHATRGEYLTFTFTNTEGEPFLLNNIDIYAQVLER